MVMGFMTHVGFSLAARTMVGNALGAGDHEKARRISNVTLLLVSGIVSVVAIALLLLCRPWAQIFSPEAEVVNMTVQVLPLVAAYIFLDALGPGALTNMLCGMGLVRVPALVTFVSFYAVGIPFGVMVTFGSHF